MRCPRRPASTHAHQVKQAHRSCQVNQHLQCCVLRNQSRGFCCRIKGLRLFAVHHESMQRVLLASL